MSENKEPSAGSPQSPPCDERVISLCARRQHHLARALTQDLIHRLAQVHTRAINEHNLAIKRAGISVLTELCKTLEICLDDVDPPLRAALIIPAALYGPGQDQIFGKRALQDEITRALQDDPESLAILQALNGARHALWKVEIRPDEPTHIARPLRTPDPGEALEVSAVIVDSGLCALSSGVYSGWLITFEGKHFIVFGYRLDRRRLDELNLSPIPQDKPLIYPSNTLDLHLLRRLIDPKGIKRQQNLRLRSKYSGLGFRRTMSRRGLVLAMRRALWRHFAEPKTGLTIHAHIAALIDDDHARQAFFDEVQEVISQISLSSGGLPSCEPPITTTEILAPFSLNGKGELTHRFDLTSLPIKLLLLKPQTLQALELNPHDPISRGLKTIADHPESSPARAFHSAWLTFQIEQNLVATYGIAPGDTATERSGTIAFARRSVVLPNIKTLFDPRFSSHTIADLTLPDEALQSLDAGVKTAGYTLASFTLDMMGDDERHLICLPGVSHKTCNALRIALLEFAASWRWTHCELPLP